MLGKFSTQFHVFNCQKGRLDKLKGTDESSKDVKTVKDSVSE